MRGRGVQKAFSRADPKLEWSMYLFSVQDVLNPRSDFDQLERLILSNLDEKEKICLKDFKKYIGKILL